MLFDRSDDPANDLDEAEDEVGATRASDRLARWLQPTPAEVLGLVILLVGAVIASALWWWQAVQRPDPGPGPAATVGAPVDHDGEVEAPAPGSDHDAANGPTGADDGGADASPAPAGPDAEAPHGQAGDAGGHDGGPLTVHVSGAVATPGVATLPSGSRVGDAVAAVGGATAEAELERINLARILQDGEHVHIPREGEDPPTPVVPDDGAAGGGGDAGGSGSGGGSGGGGAGEGQPGSDGTPIDLNSATAAELEELPGVGPARAQAIIEHREQQGPFAVPGDLRDVSGIGEVTFQRLAPLVSVG